MQWLMLQQEKAEDFVIATGEQRTVREFVNIAAEKLEMKINWQGKGVDEKGYDEQGRCLVAVDPHYFRPTEVETPLGNPAKAKAKLGWVAKTSFDQIGLRDGELRLRTCQTRRLGARPGIQNTQPQ